MSLVTLGVLWETGHAGTDPALRFVVAGKNFTEQRILGEILAQLIEDRLQWNVVRKFGLGGSKICFDALVEEQVHIYPEYTGTALVSILERPATTDRIRTMQLVQRELSDRFRLAWMAPLGFSNSYTLTMRREHAESLKVRKISDLVPHVGKLRVGVTQEFHVRADGLPGLKRHYGLNFPDVSVLDPGLLYKACAENQVDVIDAYSTDGRIDKFDLLVLEDDRSFFPPYDCVPLIHQSTLASHPELVPLLGELGGTIDDALMRKMNYQVDEEGLPIDDVARRFLEGSMLLNRSIPVETSEGNGSRQGFLGFLYQERRKLLRLVGEHLILTGVAVILATMIAIPLGIGLSRAPRLAAPVMGSISVIQTIPSLALLGFLIPVMGIGIKPAITALFLYALLPIVRNTYTGIHGVEPALIESGRGLGLTNQEILRLVEIPLALPVIMAGVRTSTVISIGSATLAALIGAGGLGEPIFQGIATIDGRVILMGALPAAGLAITVDLLLGGLQDRLKRRGRSDRSAAPGRGSTTGPP